MQAIETKYKGYRFRSRLEARWAVFFDAQEIAWEYEKEGFDFGKLQYLPDFWLPQVDMWAEVKPLPFTTIENAKAILLVEYNKRPILKLIGLPEYVSYWAYEIDPWSNEVMLWYDYALIPKFLKEHRFPAGNFIPDGYPECWGEKYKMAIEAARGARFEFGENYEYNTAIGIREHWAPG